MNRTNLTHAVWAMGMQLAAAFVCRFLDIPSGMWIGSAFASGWFIAREHAQRELQIALRRGLLSVEPLRWWEGFTGWDADRWGDALAPVLATSVLAGLGTLYIV